VFVFVRKMAMSMDPQEKARMSTTTLIDLIEDRDVHDIMECQRNM